ncbi:MAG TPA: hypothetical protein VNG90_02610 [Candidatus Acidoferrum sp.]|nr:hypothetical protein [Candidatus Acidoferrum sp.]
MQLLQECAACLEELWNQQTQFNIDTMMAVIQGGTPPDQKALAQEVQSRTQAFDARINTINTQFAQQPPADIDPQRAKELDGLLQQVMTTRGHVLSRTSFVFVSQTNPAPPDTQES